jgi:hypothetical protein
MKKSKHFFETILTTTILFFIISSCSKEDASLSPTACFSTNSIYYKINDVVSFKNCSQNFDRVEWNFGDGSSSTLTEPSHVYEKKGTYEIILTLYKGNTSSKISKKIFVSITPYLYTSGIISKWKNIPTKFNHVICSFYLYSSDLSEFIDYMGNRTIPISELNGTLGGSTFAVKAINNQRTDYKIKFILFGYNDVNSITEPLDSFVSDNVNIFNGAKVPSDNYNLKHIELTNDIYLTY